MEQTKLSLDWLRRLEFPVRNHTGAEVTWRRFHWFVNQTMPNGFEYVHWQVKFDVQRWEWGIELAAETQNDFDHSEYWTMWLYNCDPNRFLVGINIFCQEDLVRWFEVFHLEYRTTTKPLVPLTYAETYTPA